MVSMIRVRLLRSLRLCNPKLTAETLQPTSRATRRRQPPPSAMRVLDDAGLSAGIDLLEEITRRAQAPDGLSHIQTEPRPAISAAGHWASPKGLGASHLRAAEGPRRGQPASDPPSQLESGSNRGGDARGDRRGAREALRSSRVCRIKRLGRRRVEVEDGSRDT